MFIVFLFCFVLSCFVLFCFPFTARLRSSVRPALPLRLSNLLLLWLFAKEKTSNMPSDTLQAIRYVSGGQASDREGSTTASLSILDQLLLPHETVYVPVRNTDDGWTCVKKMQVRGAPALAIVSMLSLAVELQDPQSALQQCSDTESLTQLVKEKLDFLKSSRPTAVNLAEAADRMRAALLGWSKLSPADARANLVAEIEAMLPTDVATNRNIGAHGGDFLLATALRKHADLADLKTALASGKRGLRVLTHCNTGSLATAQYGTALGVARWLNENNLLETLYCTETRPYNQGARLSVYECVVDKIPYCLVTDSMVAALMASRRIDAVVVGADRVVANGDTANKIGTYQLAILARHFGVAFYVAAPLTTLDTAISSGDNIVIEQRPPEELLVSARAPRGATVWNPAFDVTPAALIDAIFTEHGVVTKPIRTQEEDSEKQEVFDIPGFVESRKGMPREGIPCENATLTKLRSQAPEE